MTVRWVASAWSRAAKLRPMLNKRTQCPHVCQKFLDYIKASKPTYVACEAGCAANGNFDAAKIAAHNAAVDGYNHDDATRAGMLAAAGKSDDGTILDAVNLNNLDDWQGFHAAEIAG